jgi:hypothetical protein
MKKYPLIVKGLAVGIILLFIGVAVAPSINFHVVKASNDNDLVEVTTQACGVKGFGNQTVKLTRQQYQNLEQYLVDFRARLNQTTTREEAVPIFNEAVVELNKYGLLPKGMDVQKAEELVTGEYLSKKLINTIEKLQKNNLFSNGTNYLCLTVGNVHMSHVVPLLLMMILPFDVIAFLIIFIVDTIASIWSSNSWLGFLLFVLLLFFNWGIQRISFLSPFSMIITGRFYNSSLYTNGLSGIQKYNESMYGTIFGFIGLKLWVGIKDEPDNFFLLGFSLETKNVIP